MRKSEDDLSVNRRRDAQFSPHARARTSRAIAQRMAQESPLLLSPAVEMAPSVRSHRSRRIGHCARRTSAGNAESFREGPAHSVDVRMVGAHDSGCSVINVDVGEVKGACS